MRHTLPLLALCAALTGCPEDRIRGARPPDVWVDTYAQQSASKVDVLWVVDNSGSMASHQENLARNFQAFIELFSRNSVDYRLAVTTTDIFRDQGQFKGTPKILSPSADVAQRFAQNIRVGTSGSPYEAGLEAAQLAIERQAQANAPKLAQIQGCQDQCTTAQCIQDCPGKFPIDFLRPDAYLYLIFVSDEEDKSPHDVRYYWRAYETALGVGNDGVVSAAAIVGTLAQNLCPATLGSRYLQTVELTGGEKGSICDADFSVTLRRLATSAVGLRRKFALSRAPDVQTLEIAIRYPCNTQRGALSCAALDDADCQGQPIEAVALRCTPRQGEPDGWVYEPETQVIYFAGESVPGLRAQIEIQYYEEGKR
jgi:hypothetical protein